MANKGPFRPWHPAPYSVDQVYALQNVAKGRASEAQQKLALDYIINALCGTYDSTHFPGDPSDRDFANGKRHVGLQLVKLVNMPGKIIAQLDHAGQGRNREPQEGLSNG